MSHHGELVGAEVLGQPGVDGVWLRTHIKRVGTHLVATTYMVGNANLQVFKVEVDVRPIMMAFMRAHAKAHGDQVSGLFDDIGKFAKKAWKAGKSKVVRAVYKGAKSVIKSPITSGIVAATAVAFPAVGAPAAAALAAANLGIDAIEKARKAGRDVERVVNKLQKGRNVKRELARYAKKHGKKALRAYVKKNPKLKRYLKTVNKFEKKVKKTLTPKRKRRLKKIFRKAKLAKRFFRKVSNAARFGKGQARIDARKMARIVKIAADNRRKMKRIEAELKGGMPGILIDRRGQLKKGRYVPTKSKRAPDILVTPQGAEPGTYKRIKVSKAKLRRLKKYRKRQKDLKKKLSAMKKRRGKLTPKRKREAKRRARRVVAKAVRRAKRRIKRLPPKARRAATAKLKRNLSRLKKRVKAIRKRKALKLRGQLRGRLRI